VQGRKDGAEDLKPRIVVDFRDFTHPTPEEIDHVEGKSVQPRSGSFEEFTELLTHVLFVTATSRVTQCETKVSELTEDGEKLILGL
jgi:hypothetical protein